MANSRLAALVATVLIIPAAVANMGGGSVRDEHRTTDADVVATGKTIDEKTRARRYIFSCEEYRDLKAAVAEYEPKRAFRGNGDVV